MFRWSKSSKSPAPAAAGEVAVQKVERIEFLNLVNIKSPVRRIAGSDPWKPQPPAAGGAAREPDSPRDDINRRAGRFIEETKKRWSLAHKSFRATGGR